MSKELSPTEQRKKDEFQAMFVNKETTRSLFQGIGRNLLAQKAPKPKESVKLDKDGNEIKFENIGIRTYTELMNTLDEEPTKLEMMISSVLNKAIEEGDAYAATFVRDSVGAKPVDESKNSNLNVNPFEMLSDEEIEMLIKNREKRSQLVQNGQDMIEVKNKGVKNGTDKK